MPELSFHERQHLQKMLQQQASVKYLFDEFVRKVGIHMASWQNTGSENIWLRNAGIEKSIERELTELHDKLLNNIESYSIDAWKRSNLKNDELVSAFIKNLPVNEIVKKGMFARNEEVLKTFLKRKVDDLSLSDRVWQVTGTAKQNIEFYLESGLSTGRPASLISQDVRQLLKEPDKRFHRIRNVDGKLVPSTPMKNYHPGQGVYRSSAQNANRLAVTNTNEMYRISDHDRWQNLEFIMGFDVRRSANNKGPCSICDSMVGVYPKDYLYKGWHPWCICPATPILMDEDKFIDALVDDDWPEDDLITELPEGPKNYLQEMLSKDNITTDSYLFKDNKKYFK